MLGVDKNTGAGGANVVNHEDLMADWIDGPLRALPGGAGIRVSLRRCLRVGERSGQPVEDLGVVPNELHELTRRDLTDDNADLMEAAGALLAGRTPRVLAVDDATVASGKLRLSVRTEGIASLDVYVDGRPVTTAPTVDGPNAIEIPAPATDDVVRLEGFAGDELVASRVLIAS